MIKPTQAPRRSQADRSSAARAALITAATNVLSEHGFARATTIAIANQAGLSTGALHHHFATKTDLFIAVLDEITAQMIALLADLKAGPAADAGPSTRLIKSLWSFYSRGTFWAAWEISMGWRSDQDLCRRLADHRRCSRELVKAAICRNPHLSDHTKRTLFALLPFFTSAMRGIFLETLANQDGRVFRSQLDILAGLLPSQLGQPRAARSRNHLGG